MKVLVINNYMEKKKIDHVLQMKIREYLRFIWEEESTQNAETEKEIIKKDGNFLCRSKSR